MIPSALCKNNDPGLSGQDFLDKRGQAGNMGEDVKAIEIYRYIISSIMGMMEIIPLITDIYI